MGKLRVQRDDSMRLPWFGVDERQERELTRDLSEIGMMMKRDGVQFL